MTGFRPQFWPTVIAVPIVLLCLGLGAWQIKRLFWKEGLIAERAAAVAASRAIRGSRPPGEPGRNSAEAVAVIKAARAVA